MPYNNSGNILFVVNPAAGGGYKGAIEEEIKTCLTEHKYECDYKIHTTTGHNDASTVNELIDKYKPEKVVAIGGDGTLKMVAECLLGKNIPMGIVPTGSANGMAAELGLPADVQECLQAVIHGKVKYMDIIRLNNKEICIHLSDIGMNAQIVKYYQENNWRGKFGYLRGAIKMLLKKKPMHLSIHKEGQTIHREAFMVVLANASMYGTKVIINPEGDIFDGMFEIIIMRRVSFIQILKMFLRMTGYNKDVVEVLSAKSVEISVRKSVYFQVDGEYKGKQHKISARIEPAALPILLPDNSTQQNHQ